MQFTRIQGVTGSATTGFTTGAPNKGIMLTGKDSRIAATDIYGNTFHIDHDTRIGSSIWPIRVASVESVEGSAYILF
tara:strand:+ start:1652 stop:1882 length:231 start_codon:yes stop_codon:yes gene_type:complete